MNILLLALAAAACAADAPSWTHKSQTAGSLRSLEVSAAAGAVTVAGRKGAAGIEVDVVGKDPDGLCELVFEQQGEKLVVAAKTKSIIRLRTCKLGFKIMAPASLDLSVYDGAGNIEVEGFEGETSIKDGAGNVRLKDLRGRLSADTGAGAIEGRLAAGEVDVKTGAGSVALAWPKGGANRVRVQSGTGSVSLAFPKGSRVDARLSTGIGSVRNPFPQEKGAPTSVEVETGVGSVTLLEAK